MNLQEDATHIRSVVNPIEGNVDTRRRAKKEFEDFVKSTFHALYRIESQLISGKPSIGLFCRMDIGILWNDETLQINYFVNEIERTPNCTLWANQGSTPIGTFGTTLADMFYRWLLHIQTL
jgi:hypothetical protein